MAEQSGNTSQKSIGLILPALFLLLYLVVAFAHAYLAPLTTGPDELAHYEYVSFIADNGRLPQTYPERVQASYKSDQPPLYHLIASVPTAWIDPAGPPYLKRVYDHPRRQLIERTRHSWGLYNTEDELWPYRAEVLRWQVGRWMAILFGLGSLVLTFLIARTVFAGVLPDLGLFPILGAILVVAFIPRFTLTGSMLNYETTVLFFASLYLWMLVRVAIIDHRRWWHFALLGLFMGLAIITKLSAIILPLETIIALWFIEKYVPHFSPLTPRNLWLSWLKHLLITFAAAGIVLALWFGFVVYNFNTVADDGWYVGLLRPLIAADASDATTNRLLNLLTGGQAGFTGAIENLESGPPWQWAATAFRTFWVAEIEQVLPLGRVGLLVVLGLCVVAVYGLVIWWRASRRPPITNRSNNRLILVLLLIHLLSPLILPLIRYTVTTSLADTAQGRHVLFMAAPAFAVLLVWGFQAAVSRWWHSARWILLVPGLFLLVWSVIQLWVMSWAYLSPLPVRTVPEAKAQTVEQVGQPFNNYVTLVGYTHQFDDEVLRLDLIWQATGVSPYDYLTEVGLVDAHGDTQVQWLGYPAGGRYPTRAWDEGDVVRDRVWLPLSNLSDGQYSVQLRLIPTNLKPPPEPVSPLTLDSITITESASPKLGEVQVWQNGQLLTAPKMFRYRETIPVTFDPALLEQQPLVQIVKTDGSLVFDPARQINNTAMFIIGPKWTTGDYYVQLTLNDDGEQITSEPYIQLIDRWQRQFDEPPMQHVVEANFANQVNLLGYDVGTNRAEPGGGIPLTLYWQGLDWMGDDYTIFTKLLAADQTVHGGRDRLPQEGYRTVYWAPGEVVTDPFGVPVDADAPDGIYTINVGLYKEVDGQAVSLPLVQDGQPVNVDSINIGPIKIGTTPPALTLSPADPQYIVNQPFGEAPNLTLLGYGLTDEAGQPIIDLQTPISNLKLTLYWRSESPLSVDYTTFVHIIDANDQTVAQKDQPPLGGAYPTSLWDPGEIIADEIIIELPAELPEGDYQLVIGMYDFNTGQRLTVPNNPENSLKLTSLEFLR